MEYKIPKEGDSKWLNYKEYIWTPRKATDTITIYEWKEVIKHYDYDSFCG